VKLWEAPPVAVWEYIVGMVKGNSKFNNLAGTYEDLDRKIEADPLKGRDLLIFYHPKADPNRKYNISPDDTTSLGGKKQVARWLEEATELLPENLYPETGYDVAHIKTFGTVEQRKELKEKLKEQYQKEAEAPKGKPKEEKAETPKEEAPKAKDKDDEIAELKERLAAAEAEQGAKEAPKEEEKEAPKEAPKEETPDDAQEEVDEIAEAEARLAEAKARKEAKEKEKAEEKKEPEKEETPEE